VTTGDRARAAANRLEAAARAAGVAESELPRLHDTLAASLRRRREAVRDPHHPDFLHPARTALILLHDTPLADPGALAAALLLDSVDERCAFSPDEALALAGPDAARLLAGVPVPELAGDRLLELLVSTDYRAQLVALAERLDHARHLHLRATEWWPAFHADIVRIYLPVAERVDATLARRFDWWADRFSRRFR
jgi:(p)ppGpp synthase/HD superfamily hydrolase